MSKTFTSLLASAALMTVAAVFVPAAPALANPPTTSTGASSSVGLDNVATTVYAGQRWINKMGGQNNLITHASVPAPYGYCLPGENGKAVFGSQQLVSTPTGGQVMGAWIWSDCVNGVETNSLHISGMLGSIPLAHGIGIGVTIVTWWGTSQVQVAVGSSTYSSLQYPAYAAYGFDNAVWPSASPVGAPLRNFSTLLFDQVTMNGIPFANFGVINGCDLYSASGVLRAHAGGIVSGNHFKVGFDSV